MVTSPCVSLDYVDVAARQEFWAVLQRYAAEDPRRGPTGARPYAVDHH
ncbi:hypothetical protein ACGFIW_06890 [Micromonospora sp. NPDC048935]